MARRYDLTRCDLYFDKHSDAKKWGIKRLKVTMPEQSKKTLDNLK